MDNQWGDAKGKSVERSGMTMAREQVELCKVKRGEGEREEEVDSDDEKLLVGVAVLKFPV